MAKQTLSTRVESPVADEVEQEAEDQGLKLAEYLREIIHNRNRNYQQLEEQRRTIKDLRQQLQAEQTENEQWRQVIQRQTEAIESLELSRAGDLGDDIEEIKRLRGLLQNDFESALKQIRMQEDATDEIRTALIEIESAQAQIEKAQDDLEGVAMGVSNLERELGHVQSLREECAEMIDRADKAMLNLQQTRRKDKSKLNLGTAAIYALVMIAGWMVFEFLVPSFVDLLYFIF